ncbi:MAG: hypothetical protein GXP62_01840, partial [Oligoflexia bacterium]|nr:hypothetical protein [Oligoflexia bacterium]
MTTQSPVVTVSCVGCGATLPMPAQPGATVDCVFCGHQAAFSEVTVDRRRSLSRIRTRLQGEGLVSLRGAYAQHFRPGAGGLMMVLAVGVMGAIAAITTAGTLATLLGGGGKPDAIVSLILLLLAFLGWVLVVATSGGLVLYRSLTATARAETLVEDLRRQAREETGQGCCPQCGVSAQLVPGVDAFVCASCGAHLLVADGILVERVAEAK